MSEETKAKMIKPGPMPPPPPFYGDPDPRVDIAITLLKAATDLLNQMYNKPMPYYDPHSKSDA